MAPAIAAAKENNIGTEIYYGIKSGPLTGAALSEIIIEGRQHSTDFTRCNRWPRTWRMLTFKRGCGTKSGTFCRRQVW
jgi:hypothetical protein